MTPSINWNLERGGPSGWQTRSSGSGAWQLFADATPPPDPSEGDPLGRFAAVTDMSAPGTRILYRDVLLDGRVTLHLTLLYDNHAAEFASPESLDFDRCRPNQQFRVEIMDPAAPVDSLAPRHVLATVFRTARGDRGMLGPRRISFDLSRWEGRTVRIRFAQVDNRGPLRAGLDDVRLEAVGA
jgi:hypothetical protein